MSLSAPLRFAVEAACLLAVGIALAAADLELVPFVLVMGIAWGLIAAGERMLSRPGVALPSIRRRAPKRGQEEPPVHQARRTVSRTPPRDPEPTPEPVDEAVEPEAPVEPLEPDVPVEPEAPVEPEEPEPEPVVEAEAEPERALEAVPEPEPEPEPETEEAEKQVVELPQAAHRRPDGWNLWDLERRAQQRAGEDPIRDEEWRALIVSLRDYARPDGTLPPEFDALVQESFGELISRRI